MSRSTPERCCYICKMNDSDDLAFGEWQTVKTHAVHRFCLIPLKKKATTLETLVEELKSSICYVCGGNYATVTCCDSECKRAFHLICGERNHCLFQHTDTYDAYCDEHHGLSIRPPATWECQTCWEPFNEINPVDVISSCCGHGWYHRSCIRKQAVFSGNNMKCPSCGDFDDKRAFYRRMVRLHGVFIPDRLAFYPLDLNEKKQLRDNQLKY